LSAVLWKERLKLEKPNDKEEPDVLYGFVDRIVDERNKGRSLVFVDDKLLEWVDRQVDAGKYLSRYHAIECALAEMKERGKSEVSLKVLGHDLTETIKDYPQRSVDRLVVSISKLALCEILETRFGDDDEAKIRLLQRFLECADQGIIIMPRYRRKAFLELLSKLKQKRLKKGV